MPRVAKGKQPFRIIYYLICPNCRLSIVGLVAYARGYARADDPTIKAFPAEVLDRVRTRAPEIVNDVLPILCSECYTFTLNALARLGAVGKAVTVPDFEGIMALDVLVRFLQESVLHTGKHISTIQEHVRATYFSNALDDGKGTLLTRLTTEQPDIADLLELELDPNKLNAKYAGFLRGMSAVRGPITADLHDYMHERGWRKLRERLKPFDYSYSELAEPLHLQKRGAKKKSRPPAK